MSQWSTWTRRVRRLCCVSALLALGCSSSEDTAVQAGLGVRAGTGAQGIVPVTPATAAGGSTGSGSASTAMPASAPQGGPPAATDAGTQPTQPRGTGPGDWSAGDYPPKLTEETYLDIRGVPGQGDRVRQYKVHVPSGYDPEVPAPAVFCIHGLWQTAVLFCVTGAAMHTKSDEAGFILIMPNGYMNSWNAGTCCTSANDERIDDVALFRAILREVGTHVNIDLGRVYATGLSNGGYMSFRLACDAADMITAVAPGAGAIGINSIGGGTSQDSDFTTCKPSRPVSVLAIHGTSDPLIPYALHQPSMALIAAQNGCTASTQPAVAPKSGGDTRCVTQQGCPSGITVTGCSIEGGGHCWFGSDDCGTGGGAVGAAIVGDDSDTMKNTDAVWSFFAPLTR